MIGAGSGWGDRMARHERMSGSSPHGLIHHNEQDDEDKRERDSDDPHESEPEFLAGFIRIGRVIHAYGSRVRRGAVVGEVASEQSVTECRSAQGTTTSS
jgi:hypothetical protein